MVLIEKLILLVWAARCSPKETGSTGFTWSLVPPKICWVTGYTPQIHWSIMNFPYEIAVWWTNVVDPTIINYSQHYSMSRRWRSTRPQHHHFSGIPSIPVVVFPRKWRRNAPASGRKAPRARAACGCGTSCCGAQRRARRCRRIPWPGGRSSKRSDTWSWTCTFGSSWIVWDLMGFVEHWDYRDLRM